MFSANKPWIIIGIIAVIAGTYWYGDRNGHARCVAQHKAQILEQIDAGQKAETERIRIAQERDDLVRQLEEQANEDPVIVARCLSPDRVRRINRINQ